MKCNYFYLSTIIFFFSCAEQEKIERCNPIQQNLGFEVVQEIDINVDSLNYNSEVAHSYSNDSVSYYYMLSNNSISKFDLKERKLNSVILFETEGPKSVGTITDFFIQNEDSIYILSEDSRKLFLSSKNGDLLKSWQIGVDPEKGIIGLITYNGFNFQIVENNLLLIRTFPPVEVSEPSFYNYDYLMGYNLSGDSIEFLGGAYPGNYFERDWSPVGIYVSCIVDKDFVYQSFPISNKIVRSNLDSINSFSYFCSNSSYIDEPRMVDRDIDFQQESNYINTSGFYFKMLFDPYRERVYQIVKHEQELKNTDNLLNQYDNSPWSIIALNMDLEVLGEAIFPKNIYKFTDIHVLKEGLLISKESSVNINNKENVIEFDLINFKYEDQ